MKAEIEDFIAASIKACREVSYLLAQPRAAEDYDVMRIGEGGDKSLLIDVKAEEIFFSCYLPRFAIYSEEYGKKGENDYLIILDPIDGSDNLVSAFPYYGASMALQYQGKTVAAVVCNFVNSDLFIRAENQLPYLTSLKDDSAKTELVANRHAKVGIFEKSSLYTDIVSKLMKNKLKFRSPGAVALSLAYAYSARYMIFIGKKRTFDIEAGLFIAEALSVYNKDEIIIIAHDEQMLQKLKAIVIGE